MYTQPLPRNNIRFSPVNKN